MNEYSGMITMRGNPLTLIGDQQPRAGDSAPDAELLNTDLQPVALSSYREKICIVSSVPSLDTPVCDIQTRRFNTEASSIGNDVEIVMVSMDLPFAQKRWCGAAGVDRVVPLSDHRQGAFGTAYGILIKELRLLARTVFVIDRKGVIRYRQIVGEVAEEPNYDAALAAARKLV